MYKICVIIKENEAGRHMICMREKRKAYGGFGKEKGGKKTILKTYP